MTQDPNSYITQLVDLVYNHETMTPSLLNNKLSEETGELSEQVLFHAGHNQHKYEKLINQKLSDEVGDILNCALAIAVKHLQDQGLNQQQIEAQIIESMFTKLKKYQRIVNQ